jgi:hypothetical protein
MAEDVPAIIVTKEGHKDLSDQATAATHHRQRSIRISVAAGLLALCYAVYRGYYAAGGTALLPGTIRPGSEGEFQLINLAGAVIIALIAIVRVIAFPLWSRPRSRRLLLVLCWMLAVGLCMHAIVDMIQRVLSLAGLVDIHYGRLWASVDHRAADLQDLFGNEMWFLVQGLAFAALAWVNLAPGRQRNRWLATAVAAIAVLTLWGLLSGTGIIGRAIIL